MAKQCKCLWPRITLRLLRKKLAFCKLESVAVSLIFCSIVDTADRGVSDVTAYAVCFMSPV